jgi:nicotinate-nucleotide pyrophosphorylase (carboxylating)
VKPTYITEEFLRHFITSALQEDIGDGDHSTLASIPENATNRAKLLVKEDGVLAGIELAWKIFHHVEPNLRLEIKLTDGSEVRKGDVAFIVEGPARAILSTERLVLNCLQRMSAIATKTRMLTKIISGTKAKLLDTRKTTPNFRLLEKWAVSIGGGQNHRIGLYDMVMLKDNHIDMAGGIEQAINRTKDYLRANNKDLKIEVETRNLDEVMEVVRVGGIDIIMLDNMTTAQMREAVSIIDGRYLIEASGNITDENIKSVADCGVDFISMGALTHSVKSMDLSMKAF